MVDAAISGSVGTVTPSTSTSTVAGPTGIRSAYGFRRGPTSSPPTDRSQNCTSIVQP